MRRYISPLFSVYIENEVDRPVWFHYIVIAVPDVIDHKDTAFMYISGSGNGYE